MIMVSDFEKRKSPRYSYPKTVHYRDAGDRETPQLRGVVIDISNTGVGLYIYRAHPAGTVICFHDDLPGNARNATVRWIRELNAGFYRAGFEFAASSSDITAA